MAVSSKIFTSRLNAVKLLMPKNVHLNSVRLSHNDQDEFYKSLGFSRSGQSFGLGPPRLRDLIGPTLFTSAFCGSTVLLASYLNRDRKIFGRKLSKDILGDRGFAIIYLLNGMVFTAWHLRSSWLPTMKKWFLCGPPNSFSQTKCLPMLLSTFSHISPIHLILNMMIAHNFATGLYGETLSGEETVALYMMGAVVSSYSSQIHKALRKQMSSSLGASGAVYALAGAFCTARPNAQLGLAFLPVPLFKASTAIKGLLLMDTLGVLVNAQYMDHAAHLGGALFGIWWILKGKSLVWSKAKKITKSWHKYTR